MAIRVYGAPSLRRKVKMKISNMGALFSLLNGAPLNDGLEAGTGLCVNPKYWYLHAQIIWIFAFVACEIQQTLATRKIPLGGP